MTQWKLVPVEPTPEMFVDIQASLMREGSFIGSEILREWYRFMLRAAPQPPKLSDERILELMNGFIDGPEELVIRIARAIEREVLGGGHE